ncbi:TetR/AcrR family transcriptional regulator [Streptomyces sp. NPDC003011]
MTDQSTDGRVRRGNATRRIILARAVDIASVEGLEGLSLGRIATDLSLSKSGVFALFGSKEELQLATIHAAQEIYAEHVITPAMKLPPGVGQVWGLCENWLRYSENRVFRGGCFFYGVSAEFDARPGRVREELAGAGRGWLRIVTSTIESARAVGSIRADTDSAQLAFEISAFLESANAISLLHEDEGIYRRAGVAILRLLRAEATDPAGLPDWR